MGRKIRSTKSRRARIIGLRVTQMERRHVNQFMRPKPDMTTGGYSSFPKYETYKMTQFSTYFPIIIWIILLSCNNGPTQNEFNKFSNTIIKSNDTTTVAIPVNPSHNEVVKIPPRFEETVWKTIKPEDVHWIHNRINQKHLPLTLATESPRRIAPNKKVEDVPIYVLDTGVEISHPELKGHSSFAKTGTNGDFVGDEWGQQNGAKDCNGHGTFMASIAGGTNIGTSPSANIISMRVTDCMGRARLENIIPALDWIANHAIRPSVILMSMNIGNKQELRDKTTQISNNGFLVVTT